MTEVFLTTNTEMIVEEGLFWEYEVDILKAVPFCAEQIVVVPSWMSKAGGNLGN